MVTQGPLILASSSEYRKKQLAALGLKFTTCSPDINESMHESETPVELTERLAVEKAQKIKLLFPDACVIGSDQVCVFVDQIYGKPGNKQRTIKQLQTFSGQSVTFYTSLCVIDASSEQFKHTDVTVVNFRQLSLKEIERYIEKEHPLQCAGSFKVESLGLSLFESVESRDPSALIGLPLIKLCEFLRLCGFKVP